MSARPTAKKRHLSIRNLTPELARALETERKRRKASLNQTVLDLLGQALGLTTPLEKWTNGLEKFAGGWTEEEFREFEEATADFGLVDPDESE
jgi:hypothetical protein